MTLRFGTSDMVRDIETFGYTYMEVANKTREDVVAAINRLYTDYSPATIKLRSNRNSLAHADHLVDDQTPQTMAQQDSRESRVMAWQHKSAAPLPMNAVFTVSSKGKSYREWIANIQVKKHALNCSFLLLSFLGRCPRWHLFMAKPSQFSRFSRSVCRSWSVDGRRTWESNWNYPIDVGTDTYGCWWTCLKPGPRGCWTVP